MGDRTAMSPDMSYVFKSLSQPQCYAFPKIETGDNKCRLLIKQQLKAFQQLLSFNIKSKKIDGVEAGYANIFNIFKFENLPDSAELLKLEEIVEPVEPEEIEGADEESKCSSELTQENYESDSEHKHDLEPQSNINLDQSTSGSSLHHQSMKFSFETEDVDTSQSFATLSLNDPTPFSPEVNDMWTTATADNSMFNFDSSNEWNLPMENKVEIEKKPEEQPPPIISGPVIDTDFHSLPAPAPLEQFEEQTTTTPAQLHSLQEHTTHEKAEDLIQRIFASKLPVVQRAFKRPEIKLRGIVPQSVPNLLSLERDNELWRKPVHQEEDIIKPSTSHDLVEIPDADNNIFTDQKPSSSSARSVSPKTSTTKTKSPSPPPRTSNNEIATIPDGLMASAVHIFENLELSSEINLASITKLIFDHCYKYGGVKLQGCDPNDDGALLSVILPPLRAVSNYQTALEKEFERQICFDSPQEFQEVTRKIKTQITKELTGPLKESVLYKMNQLDEKYKEINDKIVQAEEQTARYAKQLVSSFYDEQLKSWKLQGEFKTLHKTTLELCKEAFQQAYGRPGSQIGNKMLTQLLDKLEKECPDLEKTIGDTAARQKVTAARLVETCTSTYKLEMDRNLKNPALNASHFQSLHQTASHNAIRSFQEESKSSFEISMDKFEQDLQKNIDQLSNNFKEEFDSTKPKPKSAAESGQNGSKMPFSNAPSSVKQLQPVPKPRTRQQQQKNDAESSPSSIPVGIFFSLDKISAATFDPQNGTFKTIYGPKLNQICFSEEILITGFPQSVPDNKVLKMRQILTNPKIEENRKVEIYGRTAILRVEEIVAYILAQLHENLKIILHSSSISYAITYPSSFNKTMWTVLKDATLIAGIKATLVRESDAILTHAIHTRKLVEKKTWVLVAIEDPDTKGSDLAVYENSGNGGALQLNKVIGCGPGSKYWGLKSATGMEECMDKLSKKVAKSNPRIYLYCNGPQSKASNIKSIKSATTDTQWVEAIKVSEPLEGASLVACIQHNAAYRTKWVQKFPFANLSNILKTLPNSSNLTHSQVDHVGSNLPNVSIKGKSAEVQNYNVAHFRNLEAAKDSVRQNYIRIQDRIGKQEINVLEDAVRKIMNEQLSAQQVHAKWNAALKKIHHNS